MKRLFLFCFLVFMLTGSATAIEIIKINATGDVSIMLGPTFMGGQTFIYNGLLPVRPTYVEYNVTSQSATDCLFRIYETDGSGFPIGDPLGETNTITPCSLGTQNLTFAGSAVLDPGTTYALVLNGTDPINTSRGQSGSGFYSNGKYILQTSGSWGNGDVGYDINLGLYGEEGSGGIYVNAIDADGSGVFPVTFALYNGSNTSNSSFLLQTITNSTGSRGFFNYSSGNYTLVTSSDGFITNETFFEHLETTTLTIILSSDNELHFIFLDEVTSLPVYNVTFNVVSESYSGTFNTSNSTFDVDSLPSGDYEIRYGLNSSYTDRTYLFRIPLGNLSEGNITLRLLEQALGSVFIRTVLDENNNPLSNSFLEIQRFYPEDGSWQAVQRASVDEQGDAVFTAIPTTIENQQPYRFRVFQNFSLVYTSGSIYLVDTTATITVNLEGDLLKPFENYRDVIFSLYNTSTTIELSYDDPTLQASRVCLNVSREFSGFNVSKSSTCSTLNTATLVVLYNSTLNGTYKALAYVDIDGQTFTLDSLILYFGFPSAKEVYGAIAWIFVALTVLFGILLLRFNIYVGLLLIAIAPIAMGPYLLGFVQISAVSTGALLVVSFLVLFVYGLRRPG